MRDGRYLARVPRCDVQVVLHAGMAQQLWLAAHSQSKKACSAHLSEWEMAGLDEFHLYRWPC